MSANKDEIREAMVEAIKQVKDEAFIADELYQQNHNWVAKKRQAEEEYNRLLEKVKGQVIGWATIMLIGAAVYLLVEGAKHWLVININH